MDQELQCPVCDGRALPLDVVDFNKSCEEPRGRFLPLAGIPIYYFRCEFCGFCFAPELYSWTPEAFAERIYNDDYVLVDPDYVEIRPRSNAVTLTQIFGGQASSIRHLDYGGGAGLLSRLLREAGWQSVSHDPFHDGQVPLEPLGTFDFITAYEVFEHVPDVAALIRDLRKLMQPRCLILFSTLLSDDHIRPHERLTWWYASPRNGHISLFSVASLARLAEREGFEFGSFSEGLHAFWEVLPAWAEPIIQVDQ